MYEGKSIYLSEEQHKDEMEEN